MILGQISYLDCLVFLVFLAPQLLLRVNPFELFVCVIQALPFLCKVAFESMCLDDPLANLVDSVSNTIQLRVRALLYSEKGTISICQAGFTIPRFRY